MGLIPKKHSTLDDVIDNVLLEMTEFGPETPEFDALLRKLERLEEVKTSKRLGRPDANTVVSVAGNLLGILAIIGYERANVVTSKAMVMIARNKTPTT